MNATSDPTRPSADVSSADVSSTAVTSTHEPQPLKRLDGALQALRRIGLLPDAEPTQRPITVLLENLRVLGDEAVVPIARTLAQAEVFNELVRNEVTAVSVGERYEAIAGHFDSIRDDAKAGRTPGPQGSVAKLAGARLAKHAAEVGLEVLGTAIQAEFGPHEIKTFRIVNLRLVSWSISLATVALIAALWLLNRIWPCRADARTFRSRRQRSYPEKFPGR